MQLVWHEIDQVTPQARPPLCLAKGKFDVTKSTKVGQPFYMYQSFRISFGVMFKTFDRSVSAWKSIFDITDSINQSGYNRHGSLWYKANNFLFSFNQCNIHTEDWNDHTEIYYGNKDIVAEQQYVFSLEYNRYLNRFAFYVDGVKMNPYNKEHMRTSPESFCYGIDGILMLNNDYQLAADAVITDFVYEENVTRNLLGGVTREEFQSNICRGK